MPIKTAQKIWELGGWTLHTARNRFSSLIYITFSHKHYFIQQKDKNRRKVLISPTSLAHFKIDLSRQYTTSSDSYVTVVFLKGFSPPGCRQLNIFNLSTLQKHFYLQGQSLQRMLKHGSLWDLGKHLEIQFGAAHHSVHWLTLETKKQ